MIRFSPSDNEIAVPRQLLDLCLGVIQEAEKHFDATGEYGEDIKLAIAQLRCHLT